MQTVAGTLVRDFKHLAVDMYLVEEEGRKQLKVEAHFGKRKALAAIRTCCSHVQVSEIGVSLHTCDLMTQGQLVLSSNISSTSRHSREKKGFWGQGNRWILPVLLYLPLSYLGRDTS